jgi:hypothetical protein
MADMAWIAVAVIGGLVAIDGVGSILIKGEQYHGFWFDIEREIRALGGFVLIALAVWRILQGV